MRVLFAVNNEKISESIVKKYQLEYKEIISAKNVYYFNAIIKELQRNRNYDRIVISEDLEPYSNRNYEMIDKFLFEKLDNISDEASSNTDSEIPIILICTDRREKGEPILTKLFSIGLYSALIGSDRTIENLCALINKPRTKREAKSYYKIFVDEADYRAESSSEVNETEVQNILNHFKKLGKNENAYVTSFNNVAAQYTDEQLKLIVGYLPLNVRAVLEEECPAYQKLMLASVKGKIKEKKEKTLTTKNINVPNKSANNIDLINKALQKPRMTKPVVIPSTINENSVKKVYNKDSAASNGINARPTIVSGTVRKRSYNRQNIEEEELKNNSVIKNPFEQINEQETNNTFEQLNTQEIENNFNELDSTIDVGINAQEVQQNAVAIEQEIPKKRGRGRPPKVKPISDIEENTNIPKRGRGRPRKVIPEQVEENISDDTDNTSDINLFDTDENVSSNNLNDNDINLFELEDEKNTTSDVDLFNLENSSENAASDIDLFDLEDSNENTNTEVDLFDLGNSEKDTTSDIDLFELENGIEESNNDTNLFDLDNSNKEENTDFDLFNLDGETNNNINESFNTNENPIQPISQIQTVNNTYNNTSGLSNLLTSDKKIVAFVGTSKNGTSFLVNNVAALMASKGINTAILDLTKNKNAYYIYTQNDENLRNQAAKCIEGLRRGVASGIKAGKDLTVYTTLPNEEEGINDYSNILQTLAKNHSLVILDCDFNTDLNYFREAQEIYLVQTYDILTIQPLTAFVRELEDKNIINPNKLRVVVNKVLKVRNLNEKMIIGGISKYNSPDMTYQKDLFDINTIMYTVIPFEDQTYAKYLEGLVTCNISLNGYSRGLLEALEVLGDMVYPLISRKQQYGNKTYNNYNNYGKNNNKGQFNSSIDNTLNKMRNSF